LAEARRFLADRMLGRLARMLRILGQDVEYAREGEARAIAARARDEGRVLLTRDTRLAAQPLGPHLFVRSNYPFHQAREVIAAFALPHEPNLRFCVEDNGLLEEVAIEAVRDQVPPFVAATQPRLWRCPRCPRVLWAGTHVEGMRRLVDALAEAPHVETHDAEHDADDDALGEARALAPLVDLHQAHELLLTEHRLALLRGELPAATRAFARFARTMRRHLDDEDAHVLPLYRARAPAEGHARGERPEVFEHDHAKIREHLARVEALLAALDAAPPTAHAAPSDAVDLARLHLLDRERTLVDLLDHHDRRERAFLYPFLERSLDAAERQALLERLLGASAGLMV
jgi:uncharacterized protein with PIN domain